MDEVSDLQEALPCENPIVVHIEVCLDRCSTAKADVVRQHVHRFMGDHRICYGNITYTEFKDKFMKQNVKYISVCDTELLNTDRKVFDLTECELFIHVYQLHEDGPGQEELDDEDLAAANHWLLPSAEFAGLWDSLVFDSEVKSQLLNYASTTLLFSDKKVNENIIAWNRVVLLHGPPGTGKTSLCKALAQKLSINLSDRYIYGQLVEINSHSLFSKWFSESGKLVMKMFQKIGELIDDPQALVCVLIDEVESLTAARKAAMAGTEPSDAIRVVNALLTQIDQIKKYPNVIILTTSNITGAIDLAFVDRADIKQYIGLPSAAAIYKIYHSCLAELMQKNVISPVDELFDWKTLQLMGFGENEATKQSIRLQEVAVASQGLSGRTLRKIPFIAHAIFLQTPTVTLGDYIKAIGMAVKKQFQERQDLSRS